jgi:hypothetical protein
MSRRGWYHCDRRMFASAAAGRSATIPGARAGGSKRIA